MKSVALPWSEWALRYRRGLAVLIALLAAWFSASCGSLPKTHYYTLRIPPPAPSHDPKTTYLLGVEPFRANEALRDDRIVFYESPTQLDFYEYHRWSAGPATMLSELAAQQLDAMGVFADVRLLPSRDPVDYVLRGRVLNFEEVDYEGGGKGRVALELTLVCSRTHKVAWSTTRQVERPIEEKGVAGVVKALNTSSEQLLSEVLPELVAQVERDFKNRQGQSE